MMRTLTLAVVLASGVFSSAVDAQASAAPADTAKVRAFTIGSLLQTARTQILVARVPTSHIVAQRVDSLVALLDRPLVVSLPLRVVAEAQLRAGASRQAGLSRVARWRRKAEAPGLGDGDAAALETLIRLMRGDLRPAMEERVPPVPEDSINLIMAPVDALHAEQLQGSIAQSLEKLNRFERKYGPDAPQLNAVEVGVNYLAQWVPLFLPSAEGWPSRFEIVGSYVPAYLTMVDSKARAVTVAEVGLRSYIWRQGWGGKEGGVLRPGYLSFGVAVAGARDGVFVSPLQGESRVGAFLGWGEAKVAFLGGDRKRVLVTRQFQAIPFVF